MDRADRSVSEVLVVVGTRPEIIKSAPVIRALESSEELNPSIVHTGQHYDTELSESFFRTLRLPAPDDRLDVGSSSHAEQTARGIRGIARVIDEHAPAAVLAQGDTNAVLSTALASAKRDLPFGHIEAGIRSFDRSMPEEINRLLADRVADIAFAPTQNAKHNLAAEGVTTDVFVTGNTVVDACREHAPLAARRSNVLSRLDLTPNDYVVATIHRPHNTDQPGRLCRILQALDDTPIPAVLPAHPRTSAAIDSAGYDRSGSLRVIEPLDYLDFLRLLTEARVAVTDSGGVQEEASILNVPCLTVRPNTERPETVHAGVNELVEPDGLVDRLEDTLMAAEASGSTIQNGDLYGDGTAGQQIVDVLTEYVHTPRPIDERDPIPVGATGSEQY